jgi:hypothetical protein
MANKLYLANYDHLQLYPLIKRISFGGLMSLKRSFEASRVYEKI